MKTKKLIVIGGGASGFFTAISCAEKAKLKNLKVKIQILEASSQFLKKVKISGGGRCNVTHNIFNTDEFSENYPRGKKELKSPFKSFQALDTVKWFKNKNIQIVAEPDGRMFPKSNSSQSIIDCFQDTARNLNIESLLNENVRQVDHADAKFQLKTQKGTVYETDFLVLATGSQPIGYKIAKSLGHNITDLAPSLFSVKINSPLLKDLSGTSFKNAEVSVKFKNKNLKQSGPLLITHWGLSGPAILKLSAWGARDFKETDYKVDLNVNWLGLNLEKTSDLVLKIKSLHPKTQIKNAKPEDLTKAFWESFLDYLNIAKDKKWNEVSKKDYNRMIQNIFNFHFKVEGKNRFKEEFVECGGVDLKEVNFKSMESKLIKNLYFTGEVLDIDGVTGGFNFQNAWTTGWIAGNAIADQL